MVDRRKNCPKGCPRLQEDLGHPCIFGVGPKDAKIMLIGDNPGRLEDKQGIPFIGRSGELLNRTLKEAGLRRDDVYITNVVKCFTTQEDTKLTKKEIKCCQKYLNDEIKKVHPTVIGVLGGTALSALLYRSGISKFKNNVFMNEQFNIKVVPTYHPAYVLRNPGNYKDFVKGIELIAAEAESREILLYKKEKASHVILKDPKRIHKALDQLFASEEFSFDVETSALDYRIARILSIQFSWRERTGIAIPWHIVDENEDIRIRIKKLLATDKLKIGQNIKFDIQMLLAHKISTKLPWFDTMLAHHLLDENSEHNLETLTLQYTLMGEYWAKLERLKVKLAKKHGIKKEDVTYDMFPLKDLLLYGAKDADCTFRLKPLFYKQMQKEEVYGVFKNYVMDFTPVLVEAEFRGIKVNREKLKGLLIDYNKKHVDLEKLLYEDDEVKKYESSKRKDVEKVIADHYKKMTDKLAVKYEVSKNLKSRFPNGVDEYLEHRYPGGVASYVKKMIKEDECKFNFNSGKQLQGLFFDQMNLIPVRATKTGYSTDAETLESLDDQGAEIITKLLEYRKLGKYISTYLLSTYNKSEVDGRIHTNYGQAITVSGRLNSSNPNMQNLPRKAMDLKDCFEADPGYVFIEPDLGQAEFRCWAHYSEDEDMLADIHGGLDIHTAAAMKVFGVPEEEVTKDMRTAAKNCVFGLMYGRGSKSISKQFGITVEQAEEVNKWFFERYPVAAEWIERRPKIALAKGYVKTWFGRKRRLPNIRSDAKEVRAEAERQAKNTPIQGQVSDMNNAYMVATLKRSRKEHIDCFPSGQIHDAAVYQVREGQEIQFMKIATNVVETLFPDFKCKMLLEFEVGKTLGTLKEMRI